MSNLSLEERLAQMGRDLRQELSEGKELAGGFFAHQDGYIVSDTFISPPTSTVPLASFSKLLSIATVGSSGTSQ